MVWKQLGSSDPKEASEKRDCRDLRDKSVCIWGKIGLDGVCYIYVYGTEWILIGISTRISKSQHG